MYEAIETVLDNIDAQYKLCRKAKISRLSRKWGDWSGNVNLEIRKQIEAGHPLKAHLQHVFMYWVNRSELLEMCYRHPAKTKKTKAKRKLSKAGKTLRQVMAADTLVAYDKSWTDFVKENLGSLEYDK